jgi:DNA-directed RNA polymerase subunit RPC12/RpoP
MDGIIWLFLVLIVALVALGAVLVGLRRRVPSVEDNPGHCSICETPMSLRRVSLFRLFILLGQWVCPHCGSKIKSRKRVSGRLTQEIRG